MKYSLDTCVVSSLMKLEKSLKQKFGPMWVESLPRINSLPEDIKSEEVSEKHLQLLKFIVLGDNKFAILPITAKEIFGKDVFDLRDVSTDNKARRFLEKHDITLVKINKTQKDISKKLANFYVTGICVNIEDENKQLLPPFDFRPRHKDSKFNDPLILAQSVVCGYRLLTTDNHFSQHQTIRVYNQEFNVDNDLSINADLTPVNINKLNPKEIFSLFVDKQKMIW